MHYDISLCFGNLIKPVFRLSGEEGVFIVDVIPSGVAEKAGAKSSDRVLEVNGENVEDATHEQIAEKVRRKTDN